MADLSRYTIAKKLNAFEQLKLTRKLSQAIPIVSGLVDEANKGKPKAILLIFALGSISDDDCQFVIDLCLSCIYVNQGQAQPQAPLMAGGKCMFDDITMDEILELTSKVIEANIGDFLNTALPGLKEKAGQ